ncbi:MAG TPA: hypothetical protein VF407_04360 [Polyangiaceae bacterium]
MELSLVVCPNCGAPLETHAVKTVVVCKHCGASVARGIHDVKAAKFTKVAHERAKAITPKDDDVEIAGRRFTLEGRIGRGESADVFVGREARPASSVVVVKILHADGDRDLLAREYQVLGALVRSELREAAYLSTLVPYPLHEGEATQRGASLGHATVYRASSSFVHTLDDVHDHYPGGVDPRHGVWILNRILEVLGFVHSAGVVHGAILPQHVVLHVRGHGAMLVGFSAAVSEGRSAVAWCEPREAFYPRAYLKGEPITPATDIVMAARSVAYLLGAKDDFLLPSSVPHELATIVTRYAHAEPSALRVTAAEVLEHVANAAFEAFGKPKFVNLEMPAWPRA